MSKTTYVKWFDDPSSGDVSVEGGKNASLGVMIRELKEAGIRVPGGFALTAAAYWKYLDGNGIKERIQAEIDAFETGKKPLQATGKAIRRLFLNGSFPEEIASTVREAYRELGRREGVDEVSVAVRSSATAEDLPEASFAGQQETFLNVTGEDELLDACRRCYASLFTDRAITYRDNNNFDHMKVALSVGVQKMVRSDLACSGVMFSIDTETGFRDVVVINAALGLGENVVQGAVNPDEYMVFKTKLKEEKFQPIIEKVLGAKEKKMIYATGGSNTTKNVNTSEQERNSFVLEEDEILGLARWAVIIEDHYGKPMDMEWAKDGETGKLFIVQARPETVQSRRNINLFNSYTLKEKGKKLLTGLAIGEAIASGKAMVLKSVEEEDRFKEGSILITGTTDPDWVSIMKKASGIITDHGGRTSHAAIVSRELGVPAIVGTKNATRTLRDGQEITLSCAEGEEGFVYDGLLDFEETEIDLEDVPETRTQMMINLASPAAAFRWWPLPTDGIGLARMEFIINNAIKVHPMALIRFDELEDVGAKEQIEKLTHGYEDKSEYFVSNLARGVARIAASQYPHPVIVRMSDFKTNEYADLVGGAQFESKENNPMLGFRGASRYYSDRYREGFGLECQAMKRAREVIGLDNIVLMIPFCRTLEEADRVLEAMEEYGLKRGENGLQVYVMAEIPSNVVLADEFSDRFDGFSIGSNDLTQLVLGIDRDSAELAELFDERNPAVESMISDLIEKAHARERKVGICGQGPSDYPDFAEFLVKEGIDSISLNPDSFLGVKRHVAEVEKGS